MTIRETMRRVQGYIRAGRAYLHTEKGRHDVCDYGRALLWLFVSIALALALVSMMAQVLLGGQSE